MESNIEDRQANIKKVELPNGETYAYREAGDNTKKTLLMIHGNASSSYWLQFLFPYLANDYRIVAPDLRGYGYSTYNKPITTLDDFADDLKFFCDALGLKDFALFGWSMGGGISMKFAAKYPEYVDRLVLHNSLGPSGYPLKKIDSEGKPTEERCQTKEDTDAHPAVVGTLKRYAEKDINGQSAILTAVIWNGVKVPEKERLIAYTEENLLQRNYPDVIYAMSVKFNMTDKHNGVCEGTKEIFNIKCKTLIFSGKKDLLCPYTTSEEIKSYLGDLATLKIYEDSGHCVAEDHTEEVVSMIRKFCDERYNYNTVDLGNGETYAYRDHGDHSKKPLVMIHGNAASSYWFQTVFADFVDTFRVVAPDLRGFGHSTYNTHFKTLDELADDLKLFCDKLELKNIVLVGWSLGGGVVMKFAAKYPELVDRLVLLNSMGIHGTPFYKMNEAGQFDFTARVKTYEEMSAHPMLLGSNIISQNKDFEKVKGAFLATTFNGRNKPDEKRLIDYCQEKFLQRNLIDAVYALNNTFNISNNHNGLIDGTNEISKIKCKTLIIAGKKDFLVPVHLQDQIKEALGDLAELKVFEESGHAVLEDYREDFVQLVKDFAK